MDSQTASTFMPALPVLISTIALLFSLTSVVLSLRADRRARESVRPYLSTEVHLLSQDMSVPLLNCVAGVAIITKVSVSRGKMEPERSFRSLIPSSPNYEIVVTDFVQEEYCLRPGDKFVMVAVDAKGDRNIADASRDLKKALDGIKIEVDYHDIFEKKLHYSRVI